MYFKQMEDFVKSINKNDTKKCWIQNMKMSISLLFRDQLIWNWNGK